jgi:hypothetical protein
VYRNGWIGPDRGHGHGLYIQNRADTKFVNDVVSFENYATGMKAYAESGEVDGVEFDGVISFDNGAPAADGGHARMPNIFVGSATVPASRASIVNSYLYHSALAQPDLGGNLALGFTARGNGEAIVRSTHVVGGHRALFVREWTKLVVDSSTFVVTGAGEGERARLVSLEQSRRTDSLPQVWDGNRYISAQDQEFIVDGRRVDFERWRQLTGFDRSSSFAATLPAATEVFVRPNRHEAGRAHVVVFNWRREAAVSVDISGLGLNSGDAFEIRDVKNLFGPPLVSAHFEDTTVRVPLLPESGPPEFAVVLVRRVGGDSRTR